MKSKKKLRNLDWENCFVVRVDLISLQLILK